MSKQGRTRNFKSIPHGFPIFYPGDQHAWQRHLPLQRQTHNVVSSTFQQHLKILKAVHRNDRFTWLSWLNIEAGDRIGPNLVNESTHPHACREEEQSVREEDKVAFAWLLKDIKVSLTLCARDIAARCVVKIYARGSPDSWESGPQPGTCEEWVRGSWCPPPPSSWLAQLRSVTPGPSSSSLPDNGSGQSGRRRHAMNHLTGWQYLSRPMCVCLTPRLWNDAMQAWRSTLSGCWSWEQEHQTGSCCFPGKSHFILLCVSLGNRSTVPPCACPFPWARLGISRVE